MYEYDKFKHTSFNDEGQRKFLIVRDTCRRLGKSSGVFTMDAAIKGVSGDSWTNMSYVDRLVELGEIKEIRTVGYPNRIFYLVGDISW